ncbi:hypothetical protein CDD80_1860 [Ophiocordyceps camponoti-rufipedis]|uniref:Hydrophobin n=1 Tax=Ophiocordyceps camponoti-rufipedis TaxID=2004952 RepID=A0A2C5ZA59_9HYPO|nr:hypothetical protein CDD80_1860 [Ophiocordyceps camponoti-rufipedis]
MKFSAVCVALSASMALANPMGQESKLEERQIAPCQSQAGQALLNTVTDIYTVVGDNFLTGLLTRGVEDVVGQCIDNVRTALGC